MDLGSQKGTVRNDYLFEKTRLHSRVFNRGSRVLSFLEVLVHSIRMFLSVTVDNCLRKCS